MKYEISYEIYTSYELSYAVTYGNSPETSWENCTFKVS